jgi:hypothetical protein
MDLAPSDFAQRVQEDSYSERRVLPNGMARKGDKFDSDRSALGA